MWLGAVEDEGWYDTSCDGKEFSAGLEGVKSRVTTSTRLSARRGSEARGPEASNYIPG